MRTTLISGSLALTALLAACGGGPPKLFGQGPPDMGEEVAGPDPNGCQAADFTCVRQATSRKVAEMGMPFDPGTQDQKTGPDDWAPQYGSAPRYFAHVNADRSIDLLWLDMTPEKKRAFQLLLAPAGAGYEVAGALQLTTAGRVLGFTKDEAAGRFYFVTAIEEDLSTKLQPAALHRPGVVKMIEYGADARIRKTWDLGKLRGEQYPMSLPLYSPMNFSSSRVAFGGGRVATLFGVNTEIDDAIMRRHQMARYMEIDVASERIEREAGIWVSHSFDQRLRFDGQGFIELHLGDAYPREVVMARHIAGGEAGKPIRALAIKGRQGDNNTFSRLGGMAHLGGTRYLVAFITESVDGTEPLPEMTLVAGARNVGLARVDVGTGMADEWFGVPFAVTMVDGKGDETTETNHVAWLTDSDDPDQQVERPRIVHLAANRNLVLYEAWARSNGGTYQFDGVRARIVDDDGKVLAMKDDLAHARLRIPRSDDLLVVDGRAAWFSGDAGAGVIYLHRLDGDLALDTIAIR